MKSTSSIRTYREDILDTYVFRNLKQVKDLSDESMKDYNPFHPYGSLKGYSPVCYRLLWKVENSLPALSAAEFPTCHRDSNNNNNN